ncbi:hypothetical protein HELRODRAFT_159758 [Helobdella robusta]|uniref:SH2 domain-containing protein n=1 Tax=Helobdella robusta TaxID=6412 RepID=T1EPD2_HELRO|nr:hypothetical protein HELRODRAFT_159758 [Helobdella robusta]ESO13135.1 hypothetical protein HELRODRAFT_159758 [Helobdella robusta]
MPEKVKWSQFASVLNSLFLKYSERGLNEHHLFYLAKMAFTAFEQLPMNYFDDRFISYGEIFKNKLHRKDYNIWMWIYACLNLVSSKLLVKNEWMKEYIYGFISKDDAKRKLENEPPGTFLLRFSETNIEMSQKSDKCGSCNNAIETLPGDFQLPLNDLSNSGSTLADDLANIVSSFGGLSDIVLDDTSYSGAQLLLQQHQLLTQQQQQLPTQQLQELLTQQQLIDNLDEFLLDGLTYDENGEIVFDTDNAEFD